MSLAPLSRCKLPCPFLISTVLSSISLFPPFFLSLSLSSLSSLEMQFIGDYEYRPGELIGHGAFALVFKGQHKQVRNGSSFLTRSTVSSSHVMYMFGVALSVYGLANCIQQCLIMLG